MPQKYYTFKAPVDVAGITCIVSATGYTGESGYECYCAPEDAAGLWNALLDAGKDEGLIPCGLGARDTLRLEAAMPLYGHEMDENVTPLETGLASYVKMAKDNFIGRQALIEKGEPGRMRIGLKVTGRGIARENCEVFLENKKIGRTTSGTHCPYLGCAVAMALVDSGSVKPGTSVEIDVRGRMIPAEVVPLPFYKRAR